MPDCLWVLALGLSVAGLRVKCTYMHKQKGTTVYNSRDSMADFKESVLVLASPNSIRVPGM